MWVVWTWACSCGATLRWAGQEAIHDPPCAASLSLPQLWQVRRVPARPCVVESRLAFAGVQGCSGACTTALLQTLRLATGRAWTRWGFLQGAAAAPVALHALAVFCGSLTTTFNNSSRCTKARPTRLWAWHGSAACSAACSSMLRRLRHFACRPPLDWGVPAMLPPSSWKAALSLPPAPSSRAPPLATAPRQRQPLLSRWRSQSPRRRSRRMRCCTGEAVTAMKLGWQRLCGRTSWQMVCMQAGQPPFARAPCLLPGCPRFDNPMLRVAAAGTAVWTGRSWSGGTPGLWRWSLM